MNKKFLAGILLASSMITASTVFYILSDIGYEEDSYGKPLEVQQEKSKTNKNTSVANNNNTSEKVKTSNKSKDETNNSKETKTQETNMDEKNSDELNDGGGKTLTEEAKKDNLESTKNKKAILKNQDKTIDETISTKDKIKLLSIYTKLSTIDEGRIKSYLTCEEPEQGVRDAYKLLQQRLKKEDFEEVKDIMKNYINLDVVENMK